MATFWRLAILTWLGLGGDASATLRITTTNQTGVAPFTPAWDVTPNSLIAEVAPTLGSGNFSMEAGGRNPSSLTGTGNLTLTQITGPTGITTSTNYVTCGNAYGSGASLSYTLPPTTYGYDLTNITVYSGWADNGRDAQAYVVSYATKANPSAFFPLSRVTYNPPVPSGTPTANRVTLDDSAGGVIAANVVALKFDFAAVAVENGYAGYGRITVQGSAATTLLAPTLVITTANESSASGFTPSWTIETNNLIAGQQPSAVGPGDFAIEPGVAGPSALTDGRFGAVDQKSSYATCGRGAGQTLSYFVNGATLTNIVVYTGWPDQNRDGQFYTISYSPVSAPDTYVPLASVFENPPVTGNSANRVGISTPSGAPLATNVAFVQFDFTPQDAGTDYGYSGYAEIVLQGTNAAAVVPPPAPAQTVFPTSTSSGADAVLVFNEIMYHPATDEAGMEWVELYNQLAVDIDVSGWQLGGDIAYVFPDGTRIAGRSYVIVARNPAQLQAATGLTSNVFGPFLSPLDNRGGTLELRHQSGRLMDRVVFGTEGEWPVTPDGAGPSLAKIDPDWGSAAAANWRASRQNGGTPGTANFSGLAAEVTVALNEFPGTTNGAFWVELLNHGSNTVALGNCILHHDGLTNTDYVFPPGVTLPAGAFLVLSNNILGFVAPDSGEKLFLFAPNRTQVYDGLVLKKGPRARYPDAGGSWQWPAEVTPGRSNHLEFRSELVLNEIMYHHQTIPAGDLPPQDNPEEWIEIYNRGSNAMNLAGWELAGGVRYQFPADKTIAAGGYLVVARDVASLRSTYPTVDMVGNFGGQLGGDDQIILKDASGNLADEVHYFHGGRWPQFTAGGGSSLELRDPNADNAPAEAWAASTEAGKSSWQTFTYRKVAQASATPDADGVWRDFVLGLLGEGECWIDDISVVQAPTNNPVQMIANGNFESGLAGWRVLGNHRGSRVEVDPDNAGNHALHVLASGPQEHMHNHVETTLANGAAVANGQLYEISFRARWIAGNRLLNTRLYFNRVARTTALAVPQLNGTPGAMNSTFTPNLGPTFRLFQHQPVTPQPNQPVMVSVRADDPDGVSACAVWWSVNGGAWTNTAMLPTNGMFTGTIPGRSINTLVQFFVQAVDGRGAVSTYPAKGTNSGAFYRVYDGQANLRLNHTLRILMAPANITLQLATTNLMSNENLPCTVVYDERQAYYDAAVRLKSSERGRVEAGRIGFHLEFQPDDLFRGVHPVLLVDRSGGADRPAQEEILLRHLAAKSGVPEVSADLCRVIAPQSAQNGMAILSPRFEDNFVATAFPSGSAGTLYELELTYFPTSADAAGYKLPAPDNVQGVDISDLGTEKENYRYNLIIKNHRDADDYSKLMNFARSWSLSGAALEAQLPLTTDLDEWLRTYALVTLGGVSDMYTFGGSHNVLLYLSPDDARVRYFPWDMDHSFFRSPTDALIGGQNLSKIVNLPGNLRRFYAHLLDLIATTYNPSYMTYWVNHYGLIAGQDYSTDLSYILQRGVYASNAINAAGGSTPFSVNGTNFLNVSNNLVTLSGTAPVGLTSLLVNGIGYPVTWSSISTWSLQVPIGSISNVLTVQGYDLHGNLLTNSTRTIIFSGPVPDPSQVVINEIMYQPILTNSEFLELFNASTNSSFDLSDWRINGLGYTFPDGTIIRPQSFLVLAKDRTAFAAAYGSEIPVFDTFDGKLDPDGETLTLFRPDLTQPNAEVVVDRVRYEAVPPWPKSANGASLQLISADQDNSRVANWKIVTTNTPGAPSQWVQVSATGVPRTTATSRPLYIYLQSAGDVYLDDVTVVAGSVAESGANLVPNGGFESTLAPWIIGSDGNNSASVISTNYSHTGASSLHLVAANGGTTQNSSLWSDFSNSLGVGATYTLSFWYLPSNNGGPLTLRFSGSGIVITTNPAPAVVATPAPVTPAANNSVTGSWPAFPPVWLNEVQPLNVTGATNEFGNHSPWVELHNASTNSLSLAGLYLSDSYTNLGRWSFPTNASIAPDGFLVVWCDGQTTRSTPAAPHTSFILGGNVGSVVLSRLLGSGSLQVIDYLNFDNLPANWSYGDFPDGQPFYRQKMFSATAGTNNSNAAVPITIAINEWMADNTRTVANPVGGGFDDWFELYNYGTNTVDLGGYYLTSTLTNKTKFLIPNNQHYLVAPHGYFLGWADNSSASNSTNRPELHVNFKLSKSGEAIGLFAADGTAIDTVTFGVQSTDVSQGHFPDGAGALFLMPTPTPQTNNVIPNTAPTLATIDNWFIHVGQTLQFAAAAEDAQGAVQLLRFSLTNAPPGASINASSGVFSWEATNNPVAGTNWITIWVTDDGIPPLSDAKTFSVVVAPAPSFASVNPTSDGYVKFSFRSLPGRSYQVQCKDRLSDPFWIPLGGVVSGTGGALDIYDNLTGRTQRFYRLAALP